MLHSEENAASGSKVVYQMLSTDTKRLTDQTPRPHDRRLTTGTAMGKSASEATVHGSDGKAVSKNQQRMHTEKEVGVIERLVTEENFLGWDKND